MKGIIVSGGTIHRDSALSFFREEAAENGTFSCLIAADRGLVFLEENGWKPTHIVGDFDSCKDGRHQKYKEDPTVEVRQFQPEKDVTDTQIALDLAIDLGCDEVVMLGCTGSRLDHVAANIRMLKRACDRGCICTILDETNRIRMLKGRSELRILKEKQYGTYVSLFAFGEEVTQLCARGVKYPLENYTMKPEDPLGVSNEILAKEAVFSLEKGYLLVMESRD